MSAEEFNGLDAIKLAATLRKVGKDESKWEIYYKDDVTGDQWIMDYPNSQLQGGGSPRLRRVARES